MFKCDKCGECCRNLDKSPLYNELHNGNGICLYLENHICTIYEDRPLLCRVDECYDIFFKDIISNQEYLELNYKYCTQFKNLRRK